MRCRHDLNEPSTGPLAGFLNAETLLVSRKDLKHLPMAKWLDCRSHSDDLEY